MAGGRSFHNEGPTTAYGWLEGDHSTMKGANHCIRMAGGRSFHNEGPTTANA